MSKTSLNSRKNALHEIKQTLSKYILYFHTNVQLMNNSKVFAGLIVIILNLASRFVTIKLSKSVESYLKFTVSRDILVFCLVWMGSREIYVAILFTVLFTLIVDYLLNEESAYCILPESFTTYHTNLLDRRPSEEEIEDAKLLLEKARKTSSIENYI